MPPASLSRKPGDAKWSGEAMFMTPSVALASAVQDRHPEAMALTHDEALAVQRRHESRLMALPGVTGLGVKLRDGDLVLEVSVDPDKPVPAELSGLHELEGLPVVVERQRYELQ